ncbi:MAG: hypothetical protein KDD50_12630, partial [Bdellovibrionales bacterium]|nr:hypothetical protein [Bdellovibrionales bacterium]
MNKRLLFRSFFIGFLLFGLFFSIGFIKRYHIPKFQNWILLEIEQYSRANLPVRIWPKSVEISFFPLGLKFNDIDILPKNKLAQQLAPISIKDISLQLNIFSLLIGEVRLSSVQINNPEVLIETELTQKESDKTEGIKVDKDLPKELSVKALSKYPVDEIYINNLNLMVRDSNKAYSLKANDLDFTLKNLTGLILLEVNSPKISFLKHKTKSLFNALVDAKLLLNDDSIHLSSFKFKNEESYIVASGLIEGQWLKKNFSKIQLNTRSQIEFDSLVKNLNPFIKNQLPLIEGSMNLDLSYNKEKTELISFDLNSNKVFISKHELGQVVLKGSLDNGDLKIQRLSAHTSAGHVKFKDFTLLDKEKYRFKSVVQIPQLEIRQLLRSIQVGDTPMRINVQGELPCEGVVKPKFELNCKKGNLKISDFLVHSGLPAKKTIIAVKEIDINGDLSVDQEKVSYTGNLQINDSKGSSHGVIDFKKGFNIYYDTDELDFKNIESFLDLDFEGKVKLHGNTVGTSKWATVDMDASTQDFWFENYKLDRSKFHFSYKNSYLKFLNIKGQQRTSDYSGLVSINLKKDKIYLKLNSTFLDTQDILQSFSRKVTLPFEISGTGHAEVKAWGPLQFNILNYDFKAALFRGQFAKESYDEAFAHIISENGNVKTKNFYINKGAGKIQIESKVQPNGLMDTQIIGRGLKIEESKNINRLNLDMKGILNINTHLKGHILHPDTEIVGSASSVKIGETPMSNSNFKLKLNSEYFQGSGFLMDKSVVADFKIPFKEDEEFWFKFDSKNWSFTRFFSIFSNNEKQKKY